MRNQVVKYITIILALSISGCSNQQKHTAHADSEIENIINQMSIGEKIDMIGGYDRFNIRPNERLNIPEIKMTDGPLGVRSINGEATAFPASIALAASWDRKLVEKVGAAIAQEAKAKGKNILLAPGMNICRAPMDGRNFEYLGEDPYLSGEIAVSYINGVQKEGVVATAKHFVANNQEYDRHNTNSDMDERTLREIYLPAFKACVQKGHVGAVMTSYNPINGIHASENDYLINRILKKEWGFKGFVMSDWASTYNGVAAANAGLDLEMPYGKHMNRGTLLPAIKSGKLKKEVIDDKIRRILRIYKRFGFLDGNTQRVSKKINWAADKQIALEAARGSIVLLKNNNNILPLENVKSIAVLGPNGYPAVYRGGGSSEVNPKRTISVFEGLKELAKGGKVEFEAGPVNKLTEGISKLSAFYTYDNGKKVKGLTGEYFANMNLKGPPSFTRVDTNVFFRWVYPIHDGFPADFFSVRWTGKIKVRESGQYKFIVSGDDGFRLFIDNKLVIDQWRDQAETQKTAVINIKANKGYDIKFEFYDNQGPAAARLGYYKLGSSLKAEELAKKSDAAIVCVGFNELLEAEGSDRPFEMSKEQISFIKKIASINPKTVVVLFGGGNMKMLDFIDHIDGLLHAWYPGQEGGKAIAEIILGKVNPSGKLPVSFEKEWKDNATFDSYYDKDGDKHVFYKEGVFIGYRYFDKYPVEPLFHFGFGLSYTTFTFDKLIVKKIKAGKTTKIQVSVEVTNTGDKAGAEVVQVYVGDLESSVVRPVKELKGFEKVFLQAGESRNVIISLPEDAFKFYDINAKSWVLEKGVFEILVGNSSANILQKSKIEL